MGFILDTLERTLGLTDAEKKIIEPALPVYAKWISMLNWDAVSDGVAWLSRSRPVADRLISDGKTISPIAQSVLLGGGSIFDAPTVMGAAKDAEATVKANPQMVNALTADYGKLAPLIAQAQKDWPNVEQATMLLYGKMQGSNVKMSDVLQAHFKE